MAELINLRTFADGRGFLSVCEEVPFTVRRVYWIYNTLHDRGGHAHKKTRQALISLQGVVTVDVKDGRTAYILDKPDKMLILEPEDWHTMEDFSEDNILLVLASELYDPEDYVY
jgi:dTDP-4-dehydrorhamnose 3,5-epimerase-like enzyme